MSAGPSQPPVRPIAGTRQRRAESFRSLRSQTSDDSPSYTTSTPGYPPTSILQSPFGANHPPTPSSIRPSYETATALLNLDLVILRANRPFEQIMTAGQDVRGRHISDIAVPADNEGFQAIRNRLRAERESREPAYMPPIMHFGHDPVQGIAETEVDRFTDSFSDHTYTWTRTQPGPAAERFPARVRLAKASAYFVVVTLPSFRPVDPPPLQPLAPTHMGSFMPGPPLHAPERFFSSPHSAPQSAPPTAYYPFPGATGPMPTQPPSGTSQLPTSRTYPPPQPGMPFQQQQQQQYASYQPAAMLTPRLSAAEPPVETMAFTPRPAPREMAPPPGTAELQLPPLMGSHAAGPSGAPSGEAARQQVSSDDEEDGDGGGRVRSPKKRRRMGIDDVLQR
ncbi:hypothetical protein LTR85_009823 [Meristemomyces frigidus]|nr:hypothetical protein LTR85_009823 [Meristemomyces frigidus]